MIVATGSVPYPGTGSTGDGYRIAKEVGHGVTALLPALVPLQTREKYVRELSGLSLKNVEVSVFSGDKKTASEFGERRSTHFGLSGPVILSLSGDIAAPPGGKRENDSFDKF